MVDNYAAEGIRRLVIAAAVESAGDLRRLSRAAGAIGPTVCRLRAPLATMVARVRAREPGMLQQELIDRVAVLDGILDRAALEGFSIVNDGRPVTDVAREMLVRAGWLTSL